MYCLINGSSMMVDLFSAAVSAGETARWPAYLTSQDLLGSMYFASLIGIHEIRHGFDLWVILVSYLEAVY